MAEAIITIDPTSPNTKETNQNWVSQCILTVTSFDPTTLYIYINSVSSQDYDAEIYIEEDPGLGPPHVPAPDQTGHILYSGTIPKADLNAHIDEYYQFTVALTGTARLLIGTYYHIVVWFQDPTPGQRYAVAGETTGPQYVQFTFSSGNDPTNRQFSPDANNKDIAIDLWGENEVGALVDTPGNLRVKGERLHYGDGEGWERYIQGFDSGETGTAGQIGYESAGVTLRYADATGVIREFALQDTGDDDTAGKIGYESAGRRLRHVDAGGKVREVEGMLV